MKRRLFTLAIFLLLGAVVNVAVAWGCAAWHYVAEATRTPGATLLEDGSTTWMVASYRSSLAHRMHSVWWPGALFADSTRPLAEPSVSQRAPDQEPTTDEKI